MGCGKTTLGRAVAQLISIPLVDLDEYIEARHGKSVAEIFATEGEDAFRRYEREALMQVASQSDVIVACGGGTPCQPELMDIMNDAGTPVWLQAPPDVLHSRLMLERGKRPLVASLTADALRDYITRTIAARTPYYSRAAARFDSSRLESVGQIADSAQRFVNQFINTI